MHFHKFHQGALHLSKGMRVSWFWRRYREVTTTLYELGGPQRHNARPVLGKVTIINSICKLWLYWKSPVCDGITYIGVTGVVLISPRTLTTWYKSVNCTAKFESKRIVFRLHLVFMKCLSRIVIFHSIDFYSICSLMIIDRDESIVLK